MQIASVIGSRTGTLRETADKKARYGGLFFVPGQPTFLACSGIIADTPASTFHP